MKKLMILCISEMVLSLLSLILSLYFRQWILLVFSVLLLIAAGVQMYFLKEENRVYTYLKNEARKKNRDDTEERIRELELELRNAEYTSLQSQINPHFLYNTLDGIRSKALMENQMEIAQMAEKLAVFFRYCISNKEKLVRVREELTHINDYYIIQKFRFGDRFEMIVDVEDESILEYYMPKMTLQPVVENALHHGIEKSSKKGQIKIHILATGKDVIITVSDNGTGMDIQTLNELNRKIQEGKLEKRKKGNGIAMVNISQRVKLTFGDAYGLEYRSLKDVGTDAVIRLPIVNDFSRVNYEKRELQS